jgi:hypothetical protein
VYPFIAQLKEVEIDKAYFQWDGATVHTAHIISTSIWPPRSPDLSPLDIFFWGAMKNFVYSNNPHKIYDLKMAITEYIRNFDRAIVNKVFENIVRGLNKCLETGGEHFEHYL